MDYVKVLHYAAAAGLFGLGLLGVSGVPVPGVTIDPVTCFGAAVGIVTAGKLGPKS